MGTGFLGSTNWQPAATTWFETRDVAALKAASDGRFWDIDTGHDLMLTEPDQVTDRLLEVAAWVERQGNRT